jgi:hypothetical protein
MKTNGFTLTRRYSTLHCNINGYYIPGYNIIQIFKCKPNNVTQVCC